MDFNTLLNRFGISSENFINQENEPIPFKEGFIYEVEQRHDNHVCPNCGSTHSRITGYFYTETKCTQNENIKDILRIKKVRFRCMDCGRTYSNKIQGITSRSSISNQVSQFIMNDFARPLTFADIAKKYGLSRQRVLQLFDDKVKVVFRREMPEVLCIDEIHFTEEYDQKYCCVLYDYERKEIVDIIMNRQMPYLREYFSQIPLNERQKTKVFISDMYDGYATVCANYFPNAVHVVDMFHIVTQLVRAVNQLRVNTMNGFTEKGSPCYNFMKSNWKYFLCRSEKIPNKRYTYLKTGEVFTYDDLVFESIKLNEKLWTGYNALQDLFHFPRASTFSEAENFIKFLSNKLINSGSELLKKVGETFHRWRIEIANAFTAQFKGLYYTNAIAECINNQLKTIIKSAYGYHNFQRFRKRAMLIITYSKKQ